ncbi:MAG TPA: ABC transporter substrate-binding protein, partial [Synergistaceae bacterium]|nr:ABC transporter substrate-binding protein [Synergistaceae bacterium]
MKRYEKAFCVVAVALLGALLFSGAALAKELVIYSSVDEENAKNILDAFSKATGISVNMVFLSSGPAMSRIEAEKANPQADVWFGAPNENHIVAKERDLTQPYAPAAAADLAGGFKDPEGYWHAFYMNPLGFGILSEELEQEGKPLPASWEDLLDPAYEGMIQMPSPQSSGTAYAVMMTLIQTFGEDKAFAYMKKLNPNIQTYTQSGTGPSKNLAIRETSIAIQFTPAFLKLVDEGYPARVVFPAEGVGYEAAALSILKGAKNLDSAKALVDWILSKEGQQ